MATFRAKAVISGDASGGAKAIRLTESELKKLGGRSKKTALATGKMGEASKRSGSKIAKLGGVLKRAGAAALKMGAVVASAAVGALIALTVKGLKAADSLAKTADKLGLTTEALASMRLAAEQTGVETEQFDKSLKNMAKAISDAGQGLTTAVRGFEGLGLSWEELDKLSPDEQFKELAEAMQGVESQSDKVRIAQDLLGRSGVDLLNTMKLGRAGLEQFDEVAKTLGLTISRDAAGGAEAFNDSLNLLKKAGTGAALQLSTALAPAMEVFTNKLYGAIESAGGMEEIMKVVVHWLGELGIVLLQVGKTAIDVFLKIYKYAKAWNEFLLEVYKSVWDGFVELLEWLVEAWHKMISAISDAFDTVIDWIVKGWDFIKEPVRKVAEVYKSVFTAVWSFIGDAFKGFIDGVITVLGWMGVEINTSGEEIFKSIGDTAKGAVDTVKDVATETWSATKETYKQVTGAVVDFAKDASKATVDELKWLVEGEGGIWTTRAEAEEMWNGFASSAKPAVEGISRAGDEVAALGDEVDETTEKAKSLSEVMSALGRILGQEGDGTIFAGIAGLFDDIAKRKDDIATVFGSIKKLSGGEGFVGLFKGIKNKVGDLINDFKAIGKDGGAGGALGLISKLGGFAALAAPIFQTIKGLFGDDSDRVTVGVSAKGAGYHKLNVRETQAESGLRLIAQSRRAGAEGEKTAKDLLDNFLELDRALLDVFGQLGATVSLAGKGLTPDRPATKLRPSDLHNIFGSVAFDEVDQGQLDSAADQFAQQWVQAVLPQLGSSLRARVESLGDGGTAEAIVEGLQSLVVDAVALTAVAVTPQIASTLTGAFSIAVDEVDNLLAEALDSAADIGKLTVALERQKIAAQELINAYAALSREIDSITGASKRRVQEAFYSEGQLLKAREGELKSLVASIQSITDPEALQAAVARANELALEVFDLRSRELAAGDSKRQRLLQNEIIQTLERVQKSAQDTIENGITGVLQEQNQTLEETLGPLFGTQSEAADTMAGAGDAMAGAGDQMLDGSDQVNESFAEFGELFGGHLDNFGIVGDNFMNAGDQFGSAVDKMGSIADRFGAAVDQLPSSGDTADLEAAAAAMAAAARDLAAARGGEVNA